MTTGQSGGNPPRQRPDPLSGHRTFGKNPSWRVSCVCKTFNQAIAACAGCFTDRPEQAARSAVSWNRPTDTQSEVVEAAQGTLVVGTK